LSVSANADISVVITCFNYGRFLDDAVSSALTQHGGPPNVVVVDDGSTEPDTLAALERLPSDVQLLRIANQGLAAARNAGATYAGTPFVIPLDADDMLTRGALRALRGALAPNPQLGFTYGLTEMVGSHSGVLRMPPYDPWRLLYRSIVSHTALIRTEAFAATGGYDPSVYGYEDWDFYLRLLGQGWEGRQLPEVTLRWRRHGPSMLSDVRRDYRTRYRALRRRHAPLYARARQLRARTELGPLGRLAYRTFWAWRPVPARVEAAAYRFLFR
jgi:glycosyltransferase involved in cell wall biosynthesis